MISGRWPSRDHTGKKFVWGSWRRRMAGKPLSLVGAVVRHFGDLEFLKRAVGVRGWDEKFEEVRRCCWLCRGAKTGIRTPTTHQ